MITTINGYAITAPFGSIDPSHILPHKGIDYAMPLGTPVQSIGNGVVIAVSDEGNVSFGKSVTIHLDNGKDVLYGHLSTFNAHVGQRVHAGQTVGYSGSSGSSTGPHLHLQLMQNGIPIDPVPYLKHSHSFFDFIKDPFGVIGQQLHDGLYSLFQTVDASLDPLMGIVLAVLIFLRLFQWEKAGKLILPIFGIYIILKVIL